MEVYIFNSEYPFGANTYVISSDGEYAVIDPAAAPETVFSSLNVSPADFRYVILTHAHFDHTLFIDQWQNATSLPVTVSYADAPMLKDSYLSCYELFLGSKRTFSGEISELSDGDLLPLGDIMLKIHSTPGHTPGSIVIDAGDALFVGDTVFAGGGYGRCDLPGGDFQELKKSIKKISLFDPDTVIYSGHGEKTRVSKIIRF